MEPEPQQSTTCGVKYRDTSTATSSHTPSPSRSCQGVQLRYPAAASTPHPAATAALQPCTTRRRLSSLLQRQQPEQMYCSELILLRTTHRRFTPLHPRPLLLPVACLLCLYTFDPGSACGGRLGEGPAQIEHAGPHGNTTPSCHHLAHLVSTAPSPDGSYDPEGGSQCWASLGLRRGLRRPEVLCCALQRPWIPTSSVL